MKMTAFALSLAAAVITLAAAPAFADTQTKPVTFGDLTLSEIWARTTPPTAKTGAVYFVINNAGQTDDLLLGMSAGVSNKTEIHSSKMDGGIMKMQQVGKVVVPAGGKAVLQPGGFHIMLRGLHGPLKQGDSFPLTLTFKNTGKVTIEVKVMKKARAVKSQTK